MSVSENLKIDRFIFTFSIRMHKILSIKGVNSNR